MKKIFTLLLLTFAFQIYSFTPPQKADEITPDFLRQVGEQTGFCDHIPHIQKIFENYKVKTLLEFGLGYSTKYFLDACTKVISVEFVTKGVGPGWIKNCLSLYQSYSNWVPVAYFSNYPGDFGWAPYKFFGTTKFYEAELQYVPSLVIPPDNGYLTELRTFIGNLTKYNKIDVAFVDPSTLLRGPIVQLLFDKAPIILAHDTNSSYTNPNAADIYGYRRVDVPENYEVISIRKGVGTLLWIKKTDETKALIEVMKEYAQSF